MAINNASLLNFSIHCYEVKIKAKEFFSIPYFPGSMLRGAFGVALKKVVCLYKKEQDCKGCLLKKSCVYRFLFETGTQSLSISNPPHPLMLYPLSLGGKQMRKGSVYQFGFTLFGKAIDYLPYVVYAIMQMGKIGIGKGKGKFELVSIKKYISEKRKKEVFFGQRLIPIDKALEVKSIFKKKWKEKKLILETITPLRLKVHGRLSDNISLKDIILAITRRLKVLSALYGEGEINLLKGILIEEMLKDIKITTDFKWQDFKRFSKRQDAYLHIGGVVGRMILTGNLSLIYPLLKLGEYIHVGKNTAFGLGRYRLA